MIKREMFLKALIENPTITKAIEQVGISKQTAYRFMKDEDFQRDLMKIKSDAMGEAVTYLQGKLTRCSEVLMDIVEDFEVSAQVRINAINSVFTNCKAMTETVDIMAKLSELEERTKSNGKGGENE